MDVTSNALLELDEYLHIISHALIIDDWFRAESALIEAMSQWEENGELQYLYGSVCAHLKRFDEAVDWLSKSLKNNVISLYPAAFQLGLIHVTSGRIPLATEAWLPLNDLPEDHYFRLFSDGMQFLVTNQLDQAKKYLELGMTKNQDFPSINRDMAHAVSQIDHVLGETKAVDNFYGNSSRLH